MIQLYAIEHIGSIRQVDDGEWVHYADHLAAVEQARKAGYNLACTVNDGCLYANMYTYGEAVKAEAKAAQSGKE